MKILFIHPSVELYGADKILLYLLKILYKENSITVLLPKDGVLVNSIKEISNTIKIIINDNLPIVHSRLGLHNILKLPFFVKNFSKLFEKKSFDLVYCNTLATVMLLYTAWSKNKVIHVHEIIENPILNFGFSVLIKLRATKVICVSNHVKQNLLFSKKYQVIHNGIPDLYGKKTNPIKIDKTIRFVLPGRFMPKKGQWFLIETLKILPKDELSKCEFYLFGSPPPNRIDFGKELDELIEKNKLESIIHLCPFTNNIDYIYKDADVILVPSLMADSFPTTVLEAMMYSKPVISTNHGGASEIIEDSFGILINPNDTIGFMKALSFFINNKKIISSMGNRARLKFENYLTLEKFEERFKKELLI